MIKRVWGQNFLPFREPVTFSLEKQGLVLIRGLNKVSAALNDNGSGKTSILHLIAWILFGEDLKGRKGDAVANRFTDEACVGEMDLEDDLGPWSIQRARRPASLVVEGLDVPKDSNMDVVQAAIESRLGFGLRTFKNAVIFGQGSFDRFAHAEQADQMKMLDEIQGIDYTEPRKNAAAWRKDLSETVEQIAGEISVDNATLAAKRGEVQTLTALRDSYDTTKRLALSGLEARLRALTETMKATERDVWSLTKDTELLERLRAEDKVLTECDAALSLTRQNEDEAGALQDEAGRNLRQFDEKLERLLTHTECPECLGLIKGFSKNVKDRFAKRREPLATEATGATEAYRACLAASKLALEAVEAQQAVMRKMVGGTDDLQRIIMRLEERCSPVNMKRLKARLLTETKAVQDMDANIKKAKGETWDGAAKLADAEAAVTLLTARIARETGRFEKAGFAVGLAEYCVDAFGDRGIRSLMVDSVSEFVNDRMGEHLEVLTAGEASNRMSATQTNKKGNTKERITFTPSWTWGGEGTDSGSGGQDRRIDLATFASMQDLAESRSARPFPFKAYDEPFDALDSRGKEIACQWLRAQVKQYGTVLLITHSEELAGLANPDQTWTIEHSEDGAHLLLS